MNTPNMLNIDCSEIDTFYRYKMPAPVLRVEGGGKYFKTFILNLNEISTSLNVKEVYLGKFIALELGVSSGKDHGYSFYRGTHSLVAIQMLITNFIEIFVLCDKCRLPELSLSAKKTHLFQSCRSCGNKFEIHQEKHKLVSFITSDIIHNGPPETTRIEPSAPMEEDVDEFNFDIENEAKKENSLLLETPPPEYQFGEKNELDRVPELIKPSDLLLPHWLQPKPNPIPIGITNLSNQITLVRQADSDADVGNWSDSDTYDIGENNVDALIDDPINDVLNADSISIPEGFYSHDLDMELVKSEIEQAIRIDKKVYPKLDFDFDPDEDSKLELWIDFSTEAGEYVIEKITNVEALKQPVPTYQSFSNISGNISGNFTGYPHININNRNTYQFNRPNGFPTGSFSYSQPSMAQANVCDWREWSPLTWSFLSRLDKEKRMAKVFNFVKYQKKYITEAYEIKPVDAKRIDIIALELRYFADRLDLECFVCGYVVELLFTNNIIADNEIRQYKRLLKGISKNNSDCQMFIVEAFGLMVSNKLELIAIFADICEQLILYNIVDYDALREWNNAEKHFIDKDNFTTLQLEIMELLDRNDEDDPDLANLFSTDYSGLPLTTGYDFNNTFETNNLSQYNDNSHTNVIDYFGGIYD